MDMVFQKCGNYDYNKVGKIEKKINKKTAYGTSM